MAEGLQDVERMKPQMFQLRRGSIGEDVDHEAGELWNEPDHEEIVQQIE